MRKVISHGDPATFSAGMTASPDPSKNADKCLPPPLKDSDMFITKHGNPDALREAEETAAARRTESRIPVHALMGRTKIYRGFTAAELDARIDQYRLLESEQGNVLLQKIILDARIKEAREAADKEAAAHNQTITELMNLRESIEWPGLKI